MGGYLLFAVLGYLLHTTELSRLQRSAIYVLGILGAAVRYFHTVIFSVREGAINKLTWEYTNWPTILLAAAIFVFIKYACDYPIFRNEKFIRLIKWLSGASFGIYLIHVLVIDRIYIVVFGRYIKRMVAAIRRVCGLFCRSAACKGIAEDPVCRQIFVSIKIYTVRIAELTVRFRPKG